MLSNLLINNYALIEHLDIDFPEGFSVITGETGAGKSIILGALGLLMGQRSDAKAIKAGQKKCYIEATFDVAALGLSDFFADNDIDFDGRECIVRREVSASGKSRAFINDTPVPVSVLKTLSAAIIDIHSQHQNLLLGHEHFLLGMLDTVAGNTGLRERYAASYASWRQAVKALEILRRKCEENRNNHDYLLFQHRQLEEAGLHSGEQEELEQESDMLGHAEEIKAAIFEASTALSEEGGQAIGHLRQAVQALRGISSVYPPAGELAERTESARIELEDIASELERAEERIDFDPARQTYVDDRLALIYELEKKHGVETVDALIDVEAALRKSLDEMENSDEIVNEKEAEIAQLFERLTAQGEALTASRRQAADKTAGALKQTLVFLAMPSVSLHFDIKRRDVPDASGFDSVAFLFSANRHVPEQDVAQIASGGETARLMLALKAYIARQRNLPTIIFDEIDTGVSGTVAEKMAQVMRQMADHCQVICITHLPQIAALGAQHFRVYKAETAEGTASHIVRLTTEERIREIANMLSGAEMTEAAINNAKALLNL